MFYKDERLALFIDGSNLYAAAKALGFDIDYKLLRQEFMRRGKLLRAFYYTALLENDDYSPIRPLVDWLHYNGFSMVTKPAKEYTDSQGRRKVKGNMDIELTVNAMELAPRLDQGGQALALTRDLLHLGADPAFFGGDALAQPHEFGDVEIFKGRQAVDQVQERSLHFVF